MDDLISLTAIGRQTLPGSFQKILDMFLFQRVEEDTRESIITERHKSGKVDGSKKKTEKK